MILIAGATGLLGSMITQLLLKQEEEVRILVREDSIAAEMARVGLCAGGDAD